MEWLEFLKKASEIAVMWVPFIGKKIRRRRAESSVINKVDLCFRHRHSTIASFDAAFSSGTDILWITIVPVDIVHDMKSRLAAAVKAATQIRMLIVDPEMTVDVIEAVRRHLGEDEYNPQEIIRRVRDAYPTWDTLKKSGQHPGLNLTIRKYKSIPTMQGIIVSKKWAKIELLPYHVSKDTRPALLLDAERDKRSFDLFSAAFNDLWRDSEPKPPAVSTL